MATGCSRVRDHVSREIIGETPPATEQRPYVNRLSAREMDSLTAVCDTFIPTVHPSTCAAASATPSQRNFFLASASDAGIPDRVSDLSEPVSPVYIQALYHITHIYKRSDIGTAHICHMKSGYFLITYAYVFNQIRLMHVNSTSQPPHAYFSSSRNRIRFMGKYAYLWIRNI